MRIFADVFHLDIVIMRKRVYLVVVAFFTIFAVTAQQFDIQFDDRVYVDGIASVKLLAKADGDTEIKCPRCGMINRLSVSDGGEPKKEPVQPDDER